jgi:hypothetical protein
MIPLALVSFAILGPGFFVGLFWIAAGIQLWRHGHKLRAQRLASEARPPPAERERKFHATVRDDWQFRNDARMR